MALLLILPDRDPQPWAAALRRQAPDFDVRVWPDVGVPDEIEFAAVWKHPPGALRLFARLRGIQSLGAGVDHLLRDPDLPAGVAMARVVDPSLAAMMSRYLALAVLQHAIGFQRYLHDRELGQWRPQLAWAHRLPEIGLLGLGQLGRHAAARLQALGFPVRGWCRTPKKIPGVACFAGPAELDRFLADLPILICLLPLTPATENMLNLRLFRRLARGGYLINVARGAHLVEDDLIAAVESGLLSGACLDVFREEPLPAEHPFWTIPQITITPHISSVTDPVAVAPQIIENYRRAVAGQPLLHAVDPIRGY